MRWVISGVFDEDVAAKLKKESRQANLTQQTRLDTNMGGLRSLSRRLQLNSRRQRLEEEGKSTRREDLPWVLRGGQARYVIYNSGAHAEHFISTDTRFQESRTRMPREAEDQISVTATSRSGPRSGKMWRTLVGYEQHKPIYIEQGLVQSITARVGNNGAGSEARMAVAHRRLGRLL